MTAAEITPIVTSIVSLITAICTLISHLNLKKKVSTSGGTGVQRAGTSAASTQGSSTA